MWRVKWRVFGPSFRRADARPGGYGRGSVFLSRRTVCAQNTGPVGRRHLLAGPEAVAGDRIR